MPNHFSKRSALALGSCHPALQAILYDAIEMIDFTVICGYRDEAKQNEAYETGRSQLKYPHSKHNQYPSLAVDIIPYPVDWDDIERFHALALVVKGCAKRLGIEIVWGGDWLTFKDYPHFELK